LAAKTTKYAPRRQRHPFGQIIDMPKVVDAAGALGAYTLLTQCPQKPFKIYFSPTLSCEMLSEDFLRIPRRKFDRIPRHSQRLRRGIIANLQPEFGEKT